MLGKISDSLEAIEEALEEHSKASEIGGFNYHLEEHHEREVLAQLIECQVKLEQVYTILEESTL